MTSGLKPYTQRSDVGVGFAVREAGVDGRARAMYLKTDLTQIVTKRQILTTPAWTRPKDETSKEFETPVPAGVRSGLA